jgi:hypothetical protein
MPDIVLGWAVIILPTLFAVALELVSKEIRDNRIWRWGVLLFGIILSALTFWQQARATFNAQRDQELAIQKTAEKLSSDIAPRVAAETSGRVTDILNKQYGSVISGLYQQILDLSNTEKNQSHLREKEIALASAVSADVIYAGDRLQIWNRGRTNLYMWGNKYDGEPNDLGNEAVVIPPTDNYYILADKLNPHILQRLGNNGEERVPFDVFLIYNDKKYIMHTTLWEIVKDGQIRIHTQIHGYEEKDWSK